MNKDYHVTVSIQELDVAMRQLLEIGWAARDFIDDRNAVNEARLRQLLDACPPLRDAKERTLWRAGVVRQRESGP